MNAVENDKKRAVFFRTSELIFVPIQNLLGQEIDFMTENVCECCVSFLMNKKGAILYHKYLDDSSKEFTDLIKEKLGGGGSLNVNLFGGNFNGEFLKPKDKSNKNKLAHKREVKILKGSTESNASDIDEIIDVIDLFPSLFELKSFKDKNQTEILKRSTGLRNILHVMQAVKNSGLEIGSINHKFTTLGNNFVLRKSSKGEITPISTSQDFSSIYGENYFANLKIKGLVERFNLGKKIGARISRNPNSNKKIIKVVKRYSGDSSDYDSDVEGIFDKKILGLEGVGKKNEMNSINK